jgi:hypothetical protein
VGKAAITKPVTSEVAIRLNQKNVNQGFPLETADRATKTALRVLMVSSETAEGSQA